MFILKWEFWFFAKSERRNERSCERGEVIRGVTEKKFVSPTYQLLQKRQRTDVDHLPAQLQQNVEQHAYHGEDLGGGADDVRYLRGHLQRQGIHVRGSAVNGQGQTDQVEHQNNQSVPELRL